MTLRVDLFDLTTKKPKKLLDLSKVKINDRADYLKYIDRVPELKITAEEVNVAEIQATMQDFSFIDSKKPGIRNENCDFADPMPLSMREIRLEDLLAVDIHWKMLTDLRPRPGVEEEFFQRIIDLGKFQKETKQLEAAHLAATMAAMPGSSAQAKAVAQGFITYKSKRGTQETRLKHCNQCGLELCTGAVCKPMSYQVFERVILDKDELEAEEKGTFLNSVIQQATTKEDKNAADKKARERRQAMKNASKGVPQQGPSLTALIGRSRKKKQKGKKVKN